MSMSFGLATTLSTSQKLTPQMQQAIKLLQLSSLELAQEVQAKLDSNPLLERIEDEEEYEYDTDDRAADLNTSLTLDSWNQGINTDSFSGESGNNESLSDYASEYKDASEYNEDFSDSLDKLQQASMDDGAMDNAATDSDDYSRFDVDNAEFSDFDSSNSASAAKSSNNKSDENFDAYQGGTSATIQDHVRWQLNFKRLSETDTLIATYLMDSMDDRGFIQLDIDELLQSFDTMASFYQWDERVEHDEIMAVLRMIQSCDPLGVGARNLSECLAIQLSKLDDNTEYLKQAKALLSAGEHLVSNNIKALTARTGLAAEDITPALTLLRTLNPSPALLFQSNQPDYTRPTPSYDIPDVLVTPIRHRDGHSDTTR